MGREIPVSIDRESPACVILSTLKTFILSCIIIYYYKCYFCTQKTQRIRLASWNKTFAIQTMNNTARIVVYGSCKSAYIEKCAITKEQVQKIQWFEYSQVHKTIDSLRVCQ
jgi:hypothetical protein